MKLYFEKHILYTFVLTIMVIGMLGTYSCNSMLKLISTSELIAHSTAVVNSANGVSKSVVDIESNVRGYLLTGNEDYIPKYKESLKAAWFYFNRLDSVTTNELANKQLDTLKHLINRYNENRKQLIELRKADVPEWKHNSDIKNGQKLSDSINICLKNLKSPAQQVFRERNALSENSLTHFLYSFTGLALGLTIITVYLFYIINRSFKQQKEVEIKLNQTADKLQDLYDNAPCGYHSLNSDGKIIEVNQTEAKWLGYTSGELKGKLFTDILTADSQELFKDSFDKFILAGREDHLEFDFVRKDGSILPVLLSSGAVYNENNKFLYSRCSVIDNTDLKQARKELEKLNGELESFTYSVSHDLRSPLRAVTGFAQILVEDYSDKLDEEGKRVSNTIIRNARHMGQLIDDLLDFSRLGRKEITKTAVDMEEIVRRTIDEAQQQESNQRHINIQVKALKKVHADGNMLNRVWYNLIANALKYTRNKEQAYIEIGSYTYPDKDFECYYIKDNGTGFDMQYAHKLFGIFQRLHKMKDFEGTGVGLALVKSIIIRHGGEVWAESEINNGATFYFTLPK